MKRIIIVLMSLVLSITIIGCGSNEEETEVVNEVEVDYEVKEEEDISIAGAKRYSWDVVVKEELNEDELVALAKEIIEEAKEGKSFNAISIGFYDYEEYIGGGYTLGKVDYAPDGDRGKANTVETGEYDKMDYEFSLMEKDWNKQLSEDEVEIFKAWQDLYDSRAMDGDLPDEDEIDQEIAEQFSITSEEANEIILKKVTWTFDDNK